MDNDKGVGLVKKFKIQISQRALVMLEGASDPKMLLCCIKKPSSVASTVGDPSDTPKRERKNYTDYSPGNNAEVKSVSCFIK